MEFITQYIKESALFTDLPEAEIKKLINISRIITLSKNDYLFQEDQMPEDLFVIVSGEIEILKYDHDRLSMYKLTSYSDDQTIGDWGVIDNGARSAAARAVSTSKLIAIDLIKLRQLKCFEKIKLKLIEKGFNLLRSNNDSIIANLQEKLSLSEARLMLGNMLIFIILMCSINVYLLSLESILPESSFLKGNATYIEAITYLLLTVFFIKYSTVPLSSYGLTLKNWKVSLMEGVLFSLPLVLIFVLSRIYIIEHVESFHGQSFINTSACLSNMNIDTGSVNRVWWTTLIAYVFLLAPFQELVIRGFIQNTIRFYLPYRHAGMLAVIITSLLFSAGHCIISLTFACVTFILGLFWGWLFSRQESLLGVMVSHSVLGGFGIWFLGFYF